MERHPAGCKNHFCSDIKLFIILVTHTHSLTHTKGNFSISSLRRLKKCQPHISYHCHLLMVDFVCYTIFRFCHEWCVVVSLILFEWPNDSAANIDSLNEMKIDRTIVSSPKELFVSHSPYFQLINLINPAVFKIRRMNGPFDLHKTSFLSHFGSQDASSLQFFFLAGLSALCLRNCIVCPDRAGAEYRLCCDSDLTKFQP